MKTFFHYSLNALQVRLKWIPIYSRIYKQLRWVFGANLSPKQPFAYHLRIICSVFLLATGKILPIWKDCASSRDGAFSNVFFFWLLLHTCWVQFRVVLWMCDKRGKSITGKILSKCMCNSALALHFHCAAKANKCSRLLKCYLCHLIAFLCDLINCLE